MLRIRNTIDLCLDIELISENAIEEKIILIQTIEKKSHHLLIIYLRNSVLTDNPFNNYQLSNNHATISRPTKTCFS